MLDFMMNISAQGFIWELGCTSATDWRPSGAASRLGVQVGASMDEYNGPAIQVGHRKQE
jgi:hypothetical protein